MTTEQSQPMIEAAGGESDVERAVRGWQPIETAPKGGGAELVTDAAWIEPPRVLLLFEGGEQVVCQWDWYYADGGNGHTEGVSAWVEPVSGEQIEAHYSPPIGWMQLLEAPNDTKITGG